MRNIIHGRPDLNYFASRRGEMFGVTTAKRFPQFVFSTYYRKSKRKRVLLHRVERVEFVWYTPCSGGDDLERLDSPRAVIKCFCHTTFFPCRAKLVDALSAEDALTLVPCRCCGVQPWERAA